MKIKCDYCNADINEYDEKCPNCGAVNVHLQRNAKDAPQTIDELKEWYKEQNLPPEQITRFFIGKNYKKPKAFGIYKDETSGNYVVYKNKDTGIRAIRYKGKDEAFAVNELYLRLKKEILNQKLLELKRQELDENANIPKDDEYIDQNAMMKELQTKEKMKEALKESRHNFFKEIIKLVIIIGILLILGGIYFKFFYHPTGYYDYNGTYYYYRNGNWYVYHNSWEKTSTVPKDLKKDDDDFYVPDHSDYSYTTDSSHPPRPAAPERDSSESGGWDSGSHWSSGSHWDSGGTDWSSDW